MMENGVEIKFPDPNKTSEMLEEVFAIEVSLDFNTHEQKLLVKALDNALKIGVVKWPLGAKIFDEVSKLIDEETE